MTVESESQTFAEQSPLVTQLRTGTLHPLHQASMRIAEFREGRSAFKARDLVGLLLSHGARAYRSSQPATLTRLRVSGPNGATAVRLRIS